MVWKVRGISGRALRNLLEGDNKGLEEERGRGRRRGRGPGPGRRRGRGAGRGKGRNPRDEVTLGRRANHLTYSNLLLFILFCSIRSNWFNWNFEDNHLTRLMALGDEGRGDSERVLGWLFYGSSAGFIRGPRPCLYFQWFASLTAQGGPK